MYLHLGQSVMIPDDSVIGVFDMDNTSWSFRTRMFLERAEEEGLVIEVGDDLPRSFVLCQKLGQPPQVYTTQLNSAVLIRRGEQGSFEFEFELFAEKEDKDGSHHLFVERP